MSAAPSPAPSTVVDVLGELLDFYEREPWLIIATSLITATAVAIMLFAITYAITRAGTYHPPRTALTVITGIVAMLALVAVIVRPEVESLGVAVGTAIGGLVGALATAFNERNTGAEPEPDDRTEP